MNKIPVVLLSLFTVVWGFFNVAKYAPQLFVFMTAFFFAMPFIARAQIDMALEMAKARQARIPDWLDTAALVWSILWLLAWVAMKIVVKKKLDDDIYLMDIFLFVFSGISISSYLAFLRFRKKPSNKREDF